MDRGGVGHELFLPRSSSSGPSTLISELCDYVTEDTEPHTLQCRDLYIHT